MGQDGVHRLALERPECGEAPVAPENLEELRVHLVGAPPRTPARVYESKVHGSIRITAKRPPESGACLWTSPGGSVWPRSTRQSSTTRAQRPPTGTRPPPAAQ